MCDTFVQKLSAVFIVDSSPEITQCRWCHLFRIIFSILFLAFIRALHVRPTMRNVVLVVTDDTLHTDNHMPSIPFLKASSSATFSYENIIKYSCRAIPFVYFHFVLSWRISQCWQCRCHRMRSSKCVCCSFFCVVCWLITLHWLSMRSETDWHTACNNMAPSLYRASSYHIQLEPFFSAPESFLAHGNDSYCWLFRQLFFHTHTHTETEKRTHFSCVHAVNNVYLLLK